MAYSIRTEGDRHMVELMGSFTSPDKAVVRELISLFRKNMNGDSCVMTMERLSSMDFYGLEMLVLLSELAQANSVKLTIRGPRGQVKEMLTQTGLERIIPIES